MKKNITFNAMNKSRSLLEFGFYEEEVDDNTQTETV